MPPVARSPSKQRICGALHGRGAMGCCPKGSQVSGGSEDEAEDTSVEGTTQKHILPKTGSSEKSSVQKC